MASRVRVAASACLVASGLFIGGVGGAIALADPGDGYARTDDGNGDDSIGAIVRRAFGLGDGSDVKSSEPGQPRPRTRWGNGRTGEEATKTETTPTREVASEESSSQETTTQETTKQETTKQETTTQETTTKETTTKEEPPPDPDCREKPCPTEPSEPPGGPGPNPPQSSGGGGGGAIVPLPRYKPPTVPDMQLPTELQPIQPGVAGAPAVLDAGAGVAVAAPVGAGVPITLPVIVAPAPIGLGVGSGAGGPGGASAGAPPFLPRAVTAEPPAGRVPPPANVGSNVPVPNASYRIGYTEYLRTAGLPQVAALAVPGLAGILVLTGAGGLVGYRQAKAGHAVRVGGSARFMR